MGEDPALEKEWIEEVEDFFLVLDKANMQLLCSGPKDAGDAIIEIHAGTGGTDAADFASMLLRMYSRFSERQGWNITLVEESPADPAGIKSAGVVVQGPYAYGYLQWEAGTHRLVRRSPFNAAGSRETSFAKVSVLPKSSSTTDIHIQPADITIDTFCASGAGGQHVNRTESAVRITHTPTGLIASCQSERSQHQNKQRALELLTAKLEALEEEKKEAEKAAGRSSSAADFGGGAIRSYVLDDKRVKDKRGFECKDPEDVLDGNMLPVISAVMTSSLK